MDAGAVVIGHLVRRARHDHAVKGLEEFLTAQQDRVRETLARLDYLRHVRTEARMCEESYELEGHEALLVEVRR